MTTRLDRFHAAQAQADVGFAAALAELQTTGKRQHWIWYIFPQLAGLGGSSQSEFYGIQGREEALEYLSDPVLRARWLAATRVVAERLRCGVSLLDLMGSRIDALKLVSSLTLFEAVSRGAEAAEQVPPELRLEELASEVLAAAAAQGFARCPRTLRAMQESL